MTKYQTEVAIDGSEIILRENANGTLSSIPKDEANPDYQAYLRWLNGEDEASETLS